MKETVKDKLNNKKGFTLAELLVVLGITVILLGIGTVAVINYARDLKLAEMDSSAKQMFIATQNHLSTASASGRTKTYLKDEKEGKETVSLGTLMDYTPNDLPEGVSWPSPNEDFYYLVYTKDSSKEGTFLDYLLPFGAIDEEIRSEGSYVIEYSPSEGIVYGVFFTDSFNLTKEDVISLTSSNGRLASEEGSKARRGYRKGVTGYYGGASADGMVVSNMEDINIEAINEDILQIKVTDPNYYADNGGKKNDTEITLEVSGAESKATMLITLPLKGSGAAVEPDTSASNCQSTDENDKVSNSKLPYWTISKVKTKDGADALEYQVNFDDLTVSGGHFHDLFKDFLPGEDLKITAHCAGKSTLSAVKDSEEITVNSLFEMVSINEDETYIDAKRATAYISCSRHLENLDQNMSYVPRTDELQGASYTVTDAEVTKDIDWNDFKKKTENKSLTFVKNCNDSKYSSMFEAGTYYPIKRGDLFSFNGNNHKISNLVIRNSCTESNSDSNKYQNGGIFRTIELTSHNVELKDIIIENPDIVAMKNTAALFGETYNSAYELKVSGVAVIGGTIESKGSGASGAGVFGYCNAKAASFKDCASSAVVLNTYSDDTSSEAKAAGFGGKIGGNVTFERCYAAGHTVKGKYSEDNYNITASKGISGGFLAVIGDNSKVTFKDCYSTTSVNGYMAGGFIGYRTTNKNTDAIITNCYATGLVKGSSKNNYEGAFIGGDSSSSNKAYTISGSYYLGEVNGNMAAIGVETASKSNSPSALTFSEMSDKASGSCATYNFDESLNGKSYPFKAVTKAGQEENKTSLAHFGDWPLSQEAPGGTNMLAYRELMDDGSYHWQIMGSETDGKNVTTKEVYNDLVTRKGSYVEDHAYGLLSESKIYIWDFAFNSNLFGSIFDDVQTVTIQNKTYYFYPLDSLYYSGSISIDDLTLPTWKMAGNSSQRVTYHVRPGFASAMAANGSVSDDPLIVRSETQLLNINYKLGGHYAQKCDIRFSYALDTAPISGTFSGTYDGARNANTNYGITGFNQEISTAIGNPHPGIFDKVSGSVENLELDGTISFSLYAGEKDVGGITGNLSGSLTNCHVNINMTIDYLLRNTTAANIGLLVGRAESNNKIDRCSATGSITLTTAKSALCGGLIGKETNGTLKNSYSKVNIVDNTGTDRNPTTKTESIGGLIGQIASTSQVSDCYSGTYFSGRSTEGNLLVGNNRGEKTTITSCHSIELDGAGKGVDSNNIFLINEYSRTPATLTNCYANTNYTLNGLTLLTSENFKNMDNFKGFNANTWEMASDGIYPTLVNNKE